MKRFADAHVHIDSATEPDVRRLLDTMRDLGVTDLSLLSLCASPKHDIFQNISTLWYKHTYTDIKIRAFGSFYESAPYSDIPYLKQTEDLLALGFDGIKFLHMKPDLRKVLGRGINHPDYDDAFSLMEERGIPVLIHSGDPETYWDINKISPYHVKRGWFYGDGTYPTAREIYEEDFAMLDKHPRLNVVFAHFFFLSEQLDEAVRVMETYPNVRFDLTPGGEMFVGFSKKIDAWHDFFEKYSDRILFGTDSNDVKEINDKLNLLVRLAITHDHTEFPVPCYGTHTIKGLNLSASAVENICYKNYERFVGTSVAPVDVVALKNAAVKMLNDIRELPNMDKSINWLENFIKNA